MADAPPIPSRTRRSRLVASVLRACAHLLNEEGDLLSRWRARLTACSLAASITLGAIPFSVTMRVLVAEGRGVLVLLHLAACLALLFLLFSKRASHQQRGSFLIIAAAAVGTLAIGTMGFTSAALVWLFASVLLSALLRSWRTTAAVLAYVLLLLLGVGVGIETGAFKWAALTPYAVSRWPMIVLNFGFVVTICGGAISFVIHLLGKEDRARGAMEHRLAEARRHEALGTLSSGIAHDFNNLLVPLFASVDELRRTLPEAHEMRNALDDAARGASLARDLVQRILTYARQAETPRTPLRVANEIRSTLLLLRDRIPPEVVVSVQLDDTALVCATTVELHEVVSNLIENALYAIGTAGELRIRVEPEVRDDASFVVLTVADTGSGMDAATRERIFDPYFSTRGSGRGTGLGLPIVRSIVLGIGGTLHVHSAPAKGSTFTLRFPSTPVGATPNVPTAAPVATLAEATSTVVSGATRASALAENQALPQDPDGPAPQRTVLLVDDEAAVRRSVARLLGGLGFVVREAENADEAEAILAHVPTRIDVMLVDYRMPGGNGAALSALAHRIFPELPIVVMSGDVADAQMDRDWQATAVPLQKPFSRQELALAIAKAVLPERDRHRITAASLFSDQTG